PNGRLRFLTRTSIVCALPWKLWMLRATQGWVGNIVPFISPPPTLRSDILRAGLRFHVASPRSTRCSETTSAGAFPVCSIVVDGTTLSGASSWAACVGGGVSTTGFLPGAATAVAAGAKGG